MGIIGSINRGPNKNQSDFFMTLTDNHIEKLDSKHTIFGIINEGLENL